MTAARRCAGSGKCGRGCQSSGLLREEELGRTGGMAQTSSEGAVWCEYAEGGKKQAEGGWHACPPWKSRNMSVKGGMRTR